MMNTQLSQLATDTLHAFARRRRTLIALRGLCAGLIAVIIIMSAIAIVDALFVIKSQPLRWTLSIAGYALVLIVVWGTCLRALLRLPGKSELARLIEHRAPGLREDLISAVELDGSSSDTRHDSPVFRALLQASVDQRLERIEVPSLLPAGLIRRSALLATMMLTLCVALLLVPDLHFAHRLTRAMLPSAALDRIASVKVKIVAPSPADPLVPHNDSVNILVELSGGEAEDVIVETFRDPSDRESEVLTLEPAGAPRQFTGTLELGRAPLEYRVLAGDAVTRRFTINTAARPHPIAFRKTYLAPDYAKLPPRSIDETHGHMQAVEGTSVKLILDVDQSIRHGELRFGDDGKLHPPIALEPLGDHQLQATVPITQSMLYRVHLVSAETGFDNALDPPFEIDATPDAVPQLAVQSPATDTLLPAAHALPIQLNASDDLGLAAVTQWYRVNGSDWIPVELAKNAGRELKENRAWDGYELKLRPGDQVSMKFTAADGAGQTTETAPVIITIADAGFDPTRLAGIEARRQLRDALAALSADVKEHASATAVQLKEWAAAGDLQRQQMRQTTSATTQQLRESAATAWQLTQQVLAVDQNSSGPVATDLIQIARMFSHLRDESLAGSHANETSETNANAIEALARSSTELTSDAAMIGRADLALRSLLESDEADALLRDLMSLQQEQASLAAASKDATAPALAARRQLLISAQVRESIALAKAIRVRDPEHIESLASITREFEAASAEVEALLAKPATPAALEKCHTLMQRTIDRALKQWAPVARSLAAAAPQARAQLRAPELALHEFASSLALKDAAARQDFAAAPHWKQADDVLTASTSMMQLRRDALAVQVSDVVLYRRALAAIHARLPAALTVDVRDRLAAVAAAMRTLEAGHGLIQLQQEAIDQASQEKWLRSIPAAVTHHPARWIALQSEAVALSSVFDRADIPKETTALLAGLPRHRAALVLDIEMSARRMKLDINQNRAGELEQIAALLGDVHARIAEPMAQARAVLAAQVPKLHEQMEQLAHEARQMQEKATKLAADIVPQDDAPPAAKHEELANAQAALDAKLDDLLKALEQDANTQDVFTKAGRERARDADDAAAMINQPAQEARDAIDRAAEAEDGAQQRDDLNKAAQEEAALAKTLDQLAEHYKKRETGDEESTRSALREAERDLGIKREMDERFGQMERLADLASKSPQEQLAQLEKEAKQNPAMQKELSDIAQQTVTQAREKLDDAAAREQQVADALAAAHKSDQQAKPDTATQMNNLAEQAQKLAKELPTIAKEATKGTAGDAASAAASAQQKLGEAAQAQAPADAKDHKAAAQQAQALAQSLAQAAQQLKDAQQKAMAAADRVRKEESQATATLAVGSADAAARQEAAQTLLHARSRQEAAKKAAAAAKSAGEKAEALAQEAAQMAEEIGRTANAAEDAIAQGKAQQAAIQEQAKDARADVERAARHEQRTANRDGAQELNSSAKRMQDKAQPALQKADQTLAQAKRAGDAQKAVEDAAKALAGEAEKLGQMLQESRAGEAKNPSRAADDQQAAQDQNAAQSMARALDELDRALNGQPSPAGSASATAPRGSPSDSPSTSPSPEQQAERAMQQAAQALRDAAQAQARAMAQARAGAQAQAKESGRGGEEASSGMASAKSPGQQPGKPSGSDSGGAGSSPGGEGEGAKMAGGKPSPSQGDSKNGAEGAGQSGTGNRGNARDTGNLPSANPAARGEWGQLPRRLARELMEGQRDDIPAEYRSQVEAYYRAIAQKAKGK